MKYFKHTNFKTQISYYSWNYLGSIFMEKKENQQLQNLFEQRSRYNLKVILTIELDIKETEMLFTPSIKQEIRIY